MNERNIIETQPERTDLPLIVIPVIVESMIEPFAANFPLLHDIARIRMHCDFTLDTDTILAVSYTHLTLPTSDLV